MKSRTLILVALIMAVLIIAGSCAKEKPDYISKEYEIYGTWVNPEYEKQGSYQKVVFHPHGKIDFYPAIDSTKSLVHGEFVITNKWTDSDGNVSYTIISRFDWDPLSWYYGLTKISNSGKTSERQRSISDYPSEFDTSNANYRIYYRQ